VGFIQSVEGLNREKTDLSGGRGNSSRRQSSNSSCNINSSLGFQPFSLPTLKILELPASIIVSQFLKMDRWKDGYKDRWMDSIILVPFSGEPQYTTVFLK
jgi:hypothetical protein